MLDKFNDILLEELSNERDAIESLIIIRDSWNNTKKRIIEKFKK